ncbi:MAG: hypothetical protein IKD47_03960 [Clostridia bacterium]|nr:hypothetical protein [Clostridia bacterium]
MNKFRKIATLCMAFVCSVSLFALAACGGGEEKPESSAAQTESVTSSAEEGYTAYEFTVLNADGTNANGVFVQLCKGIEFCYAPVAVVDGKATYAAAPSADVYEIHILDTDCTTQLEFNGAATTTAEYGAITITLK